MQSKARRSGRERERANVGIGDPINSPFLRAGHPHGGRYRRRQCFSRHRRNSSPDSSGKVCAFPTARVPLSLSLSSSTRSISRGDFVSPDDFCRAKQTTRNKFQCQLITEITFLQRRKSFLKRILPIICTTPFTNK